MPRRNAGFDRRRAIAFRGRRDVDREARAVVGQIRRERHVDRSGRHRFLARGGGAGEEQLAELRLGGGLAGSASVHADPRTHRPQQHCCEGQERQRRCGREGAIVSFRSSGHGLLPCESST